MIFAEAQSVLNALREMRHLEFTQELDELEKNLNEALELKDEVKLRAAINAADIFVATQGQKLQDRILELLPK